MADELLPTDQDRQAQEQMSQKPQNVRYGRRVMQALLSVALCLGVGAAVLYAYNKGREAGESKLPPIIQAQEGPTKVRPENPGGMQVPYQDKEVFTRLTAEKQPGQVERLLPPPEQPIKVPLPMPVSPKIPAAPTKKNVVVSPEKKGELRVNSKPESLPNIPKTKSSMQSETKKTQTTKTQSKYAKGVYRIQIASLRSETAIRKKWLSLQATHKDLLGNLKLTIERAALGDGQGIFYRMQASPLASRREAAALCAKMKLRKLGCFVVRR